MRIFFNFLAFFLPCALDKSPAPAPKCAMLHCKATTLLRWHYFCRFLLLLLACMLLAGCSGKREPAAGRTRGPSSYSIRGKTYHVLSSAKGYAETGMASWYGPGFNRRKTASGERFDQNALTAAHKTLPFGTMVRVKNLGNGREAVVRINDRGPFSAKRIIDLSKGAAQKLGMIASGTARVRITALDGEKAQNTRNSAQAADKNARQATSGLCYIQAGSYSSAQQAENAAVAMRAQGYGCRVAHRGDGRHLVHLGPYVTRAEAEREIRRMGKQHGKLFVFEE